MSSPGSLAETATQDGDIPPSAPTDQAQIVWPRREGDHSDQSSSNGQGTNTTNILPGAHDFKIENFISTGDRARKAEEYEKWKKSEEDERWRKAEEAVQRLDAKRLPGAMLDSEERGYIPRCNEDTRRTLRGHIMEWGQLDAVVERLLWLSGPAGVGKSAVAQTVAEEIGRILGAVFFFSRPNNRDDPNVVIPTLVYQLAVLLPEYKLIVGQRFKEDPSIFGKSPRSQFESLISEPFLPDLSHRPLTLLSYLSEQLLTSLLHRPLLIVLDGLDECKGRGAQREFVEMIACHAQKDKYSRLRWMICSRPEPHLTSAFTSKYCQGICRYEKLEVDDDEAQKDVLRILKAGFADIRERYHDDLGDDWPHEDHIGIIAARASGHHGFASFIIRFIGDEEYDNPPSQLKVCLEFLECAGPSDHVSPLHSLDLLYTQILSDIPAAILPTAQLILGLLILYGNERLTTLVHANFLGLDRAAFYSTLRRLHSVVLVPPAFEAGTRPIQIYHASFSDYLRDKARAKEFVLDEGAVHLYVANRGLQWLSHYCKEPSDQQASPELTWPEGPTPSHTRTVLDSVCEFAFAPCWRAFTQVPKSPPSTLVSALENFDFNIPFSKSEDEFRAFAYFIQWLVSSDAKTLVLVDRKHPNKPGKKEEVAIIWNEEDPPTFAKPFFNNASCTDHLSIHLQLRTRTQISFHLITSTDIKDTCQLREDDILIPFMGSSGSGKSYFIDLLTGQEGRRVDHGIISRTCDVQATRAKHSKYGDRVVLVDTPGFYCQWRSEMEILTLISDWFARTYKNNIKFSGIIYLYSIAHNRQFLSIQRDLNMFGHLCGDRAAARVIFVSTMWGGRDLECGAKIEHEWETLLCKSFINQGSGVDRFRNSTSKEAWRIINGLIETDGQREATLLQEEIVDLGQKLNSTEAGKLGQSKFQRRLYAEKKLLKSYRAEIGGSNDPEPKAALKQQYRALKETIDQRTIEVEKMKLWVGQRLTLFSSFKRPRSKPIKIRSWAS